MEDVAIARAKARTAAARVDAMTGRSRDGHASVAFASAARAGRPVFLRAARGEARRDTAGVAP